MTDRDRFLALLADFGVEPSQDRYLPEQYQSDEFVVLAEGEGGVLGYDYYFCAFRFNGDGKFVSVEVRD